MTTLRCWTITAAAISYVCVILSCGGGGSGDLPVGPGQSAGGGTFEQVSVYLDVSGVFGFASDDIYFVTRWHDGTILHYNGSRLRRLDSPDMRGLNAVWGSSPTDVFAVGKGGLIAHCDGEQVVTMPTGVVEELVGVWGNSASNVWAAGESGTILQYDGTEWRVAFADSSLSLRDIWVSPSGQVFAVGGIGIVVHFDGTAWSVQDSLLVERFNGVWGTSDTCVFIGGSGRPEATLLRFDGSSWNSVSPGPPVEPKTVTGLGGNELYCASGYRVMMFDGSTWQDIRDDDWRYGSFADLWVAGDGTLIAVGDYGMIELWDGTNWHRLNPDHGGQTTGHMRAVAECTNEDILISGPGMSLSRWDGRGWTILGGRNAHPADAVWPGAGDTVFAAGYRGRFWRFADSSWTTLHSPEKHTLMDMWGDADGNILAVGLREYAVYYDGTSCEKMDSTGANLTALIGFGPSQVFAVGYGTVMHYHGSGWTVIRENPSELWRDIWGTAPDNLYAVGDGGAMIHYDGNLWQEIATGVSADLYGIWGHSSDSILVVGAGGLIRRWDGSVWSTLISDTEFDLHDLVATQDGDIWVVGDYSTILRMRRD